MRAELLYRLKDITTDGAIIEMVIWRVPEPVPPSMHNFKYSLVYVMDGKRIVGFDNERGKGDHCHLDDKQVNYRFCGIDQLIEDFITEVDKRRRK
jgi:hypothetical protein